MIKKIATFIVAVSIGFSFAGCGAQQDDYVAVCVDPNTQQRLDDDACDHNDSDFLTYAAVWYMLSSSSHAYPPVGGYVNRSYYRTTLPKGYTRTPHFGLPKAGGTSVKSYSNTTSWGKPKTSSFGGSGSSGSKSYSRPRR